MLIDKKPCCIRERGTESPSRQPSFIHRRWTAQNHCSNFQIRLWKDNNLFLSLQKKKVPLFKCAILSCYSWNRWVIKLNWARSPTLQTAGSLWYGGGRLSQNNLLMGRFASLQQSFFEWWCVSQRLFAAYAATHISNIEFKMHFISLSSYFF